MERQSKQCHKAAQVDRERRTFKGYAATFGPPPDAVGDIIEQGAFAMSLAGSSDKVRILWDHREPIGLPIDVHEDEHGLFVDAKVSETQKGTDALTLMADGVVTAMSIGYEIVEAEMVDAEQIGIDPSTLPSFAQGQVRILKQLRLLEISPVVFPANEAAVITEVVKSTQGGKDMAKKQAGAAEIPDETAIKQDDIEEVVEEVAEETADQVIERLQEENDSLKARVKQLEEEMQKRKQDETDEEKQDEPPPEEEAKQDEMTDEEKQEEEEAAKGCKPKKSPEIAALERKVKSLQRRVASVDDANMRKDVRDLIEHTDAFGRKSSRILPSGEEAWLKLRKMNPDLFRACAQATVPFTPTLKGKWNKAPTPESLMTMQPGELFQAIAQRTEALKATGVPYDKAHEQATKEYNRGD